MTQVEGPVRVTMVKKKLASGEPCKKCAQAEEMLRRRDLWDQVDDVVWADETDESSPGMQLAKKYAVDIAPFFLVDRSGGTEVYASAIKIAKDVLSKKKEQQSNRAQAGVSVPALTEAEVVEFAESMRTANAPDIVGRILARLGKKCAIAFSGAEDVALIDMAAKSGHDFSVFCLDTGRLHPETYRFIDTVRQFYGIEIHLVSPNFVTLEALVRKKGLFSFYEDGHGECCGIRKVEPLRRVLQHYEGWITGQRRDQSPTRADVPVIAWDRAHQEAGMLKVNPLAEMSLAQVWKYIHDNDVPYNELHAKGYVSIGCEPCTRALRPGEHERAARWWWEDATQRECGLHVR